MKRILRLLLASTLVSGWLAGCVDNQSTIFIQGVLAPADPPSCVVTADPTGTMLGSGLLDVALTTNYEAALLVGNQYSPRGAKNQLKTETTRVTLTGAEITLKDAGTDAVISCASQANCGQFSVYGSGFAPSSRSEDPGWGVLFANLIPSSVALQYVGQLQNDNGTSNGKSIELVASVKVFGQTLGGQDIESGEFSFPIELCYGCLVDYRFSDGKTCTAGGQDVPVTSCHPGQETAVDCRSCADKLPICQKVPVVSQ